MSTLIAYLLLSFVEWNIHISKWCIISRIIFSVWEIYIISTLIEMEEMKVKSKFVKDNARDIVNSIDNAIENTSDIVSQLFNDKLKNLKK